MTNKSIITFRKIKHTSLCYCYDLSLKAEANITIVLLMLSYQIDKVLQVEQTIKIDSRYLNSSNIVVHSSYLLNS